MFSSALVVCISFGSDAAILGRQLEHVNIQHIYWFVSVSANLDHTYLRLRQNDHHFPDDILKLIFYVRNCCILIQILLKFVPKGQTEFVMIGSDHEWLGSISWQAIIWTNDGIGSRCMFSFVPCLRQWWYWSVIMAPHCHMINKAKPNCPVREDIHACFTGPCKSNQTIAK